MRRARGGQCLEHHRCDLLGLRSSARHHEISPRKVLLTKRLHGLFTSLADPWLGSKTVLSEKRKRAQNRHLLRKQRGKEK